MRLVVIGRAMDGPQMAVVTPTVPSFNCGYVRLLFRGLRFCFPVGSGDTLCICIPARPLCCCHLLGNPRCTLLPKGLHSPLAWIPFSNPTPATPDGNSAWGLELPFGAGDLHGDFTQVPLHPFCFFLALFLPPSHARVPLPQQDSPNLLSSGQRGRGCFASPEPPSDGRLKATRRLNGAKGRGQRWFCWI